jgi:purine nucleosidase
MLRPLQSSRSVIFDTDPSPGEIECASALTRGMSVVDWCSVTAKPANASVLRGINADGYFHLIFGRLLRL